MKTTDYGFYKLEWEGQNCKANHGYTAILGLDQTVCDRDDIEFPVSFTSSYADTMKSKQVRISLGW